MQEKDSTTPDGGSEPKRFTTPDGKHTLLILDDPAPVEPEQLAARVWAARLLAEAPSIAEEPPTAEQLAARREFIAKNFGSGDVVLSNLIGEGALLLDGLSDAARLELHRMATVYGSGSVIVSEEGEVVVPPEAWKPGCPVPTVPTHALGGPPWPRIHDPEGFAELVAEYRAKMDAASSMPRLDHRRAPEVFIGADHAGGPGKASATVWARGADGKPVLLADTLDGLRVAAHQAGVSSELLTDSYNELVKVLDEGREEAGVALNKQAATDVLTDVVFAEAGRRIEEQDRDRAKRKKQKAKRKARKKTANASKRGNR